MRRLSYFLLKLGGWKVEKTIPKEATRAVLVVAPHTSMWDFYYGKLAMIWMGLNVRYLIKKESFFFPIGYFLRKMGAIPVDRQQVRKFPLHVAKLFEQHEELTIMIAPEGTRQRTDHWKKGFYFIATQANVPIVLAYMDWKKRVGGIGKVIYPSGNYEQDLKEIHDFYRGMQGKHKGQFNLENDDE
ncbi:MAG: 1-acyl-sn-glycerol-3-phosphate acyltransferase [Bacteroidales bacterium]|nr:1-acyl-sn-glycerol-3-phosphate acyltransferase [Bacteroidales bacterium]MDY0215741.1 1-acyl-sn-glycerol-3-phosphate acyltransferase [Bacteroidales bacterium]